MAIIDLDELYQHLDAIELKVYKTQLKDLSKKKSFKSGVDAGLYDILPSVASKCTDYQDQIDFYKRAFELAISSIYDYVSLEDDSIMYFLEGKSFEEVVGLYLVATKTSLASTKPHKRGGKV